MSFIDALDKVYTHIPRHLAPVSPCFAYALNIPGLRSWPLTRYPYLVFFMAREDHIDVWRVWHGQRDIAAWLVDDASPNNLH